MIGCRRPNGFVCLCAAIFFCLSFPSEVGAQTDTKQAKSINQAISLDVVVEFKTAELRRHEPRIRFLLQEAFSEYRDLFGGMPAGVDGFDYAKLKLIVSAGTGGESDPELIKLRIDDTKLFGFYGWEMTLLHEVFHLWSAETFRYESDRQQWFNEGAAEYYTFKLAVKLGIIPVEDIASRFNYPVGGYLSGTGLGRVSMSQAGARVNGKREHYSLIYHGGFVASMVLDHQIRLNSEGIFSLDYLMRELYVKNSRYEKYSNQTLVALIKNTSGLDTTEFFKEYIEGVKVIPVGAYFDLSMLELKLKLDIPITLTKQLILADMLGVPPSVN